MQQQKNNCQIEFPIYLSKYLNTLSKSNFITKKNPIKKKLQPTTNTNKMKFINTHTKKIIKILVKTEVNKKKISCFPNRWTVFDAIVTMQFTVLQLFI